MSPMGGIQPSSNQVNAIEKDKVRGQQRASMMQHHAGNLGRPGDLTKDPVSMPHVPSAAGGDTQQGFGIGTNLSAGRYRSFRRR